MISPKEPHLTISQYNRPLHISHNRFHIREVISA